MKCITGVIAFQDEGHWHLDGQLQGGTARWWAVGIFVNAEEIVVFMFDFLLFIRN